MSILYLAIIVLMIVSMWKVYEKLGEEGWKSIIPIYNIIVLLQIVRWDIWKIVLFFIPVVQIVFAFLLYKDLAARFDKGVGFAVGLFFLPIIFLPILGFSGVPVEEEE